MRARRQREGAQEVRDAASDGSPVGQRHTGHRPEFIDTCSLSFAAAKLFELCSLFHFWDAIA